MKDQEPKINPVYMLLLAAAAAFYVANVCIIHSDLYKKVCTLEHQMMHVHMERGNACPMEK